MNKSLVWTRQCIECYNRHKKGLYCQDCPIKPKNIESVKNFKCNIIWTVVQLVETYGRPEARNEVKNDGKKRCAWCHRVLSLDNFTNNLKNRDGKASYCKECRKRINAIYWKKRKV